MRQNLNSNVPQIHRALLVGVLIIAAPVLAYFSLTMGTPILGLIIPIVLIVSLLLERPWLIYICGLVATEAMLKLPGLPDALGVPQIFQMLLVGWAILDAAMHKHKSRFSYDRRIDIWMALFFINVIFLMIVTGAGVRVQGQGAYGGSVYLGLLTGTGLYFSAVKLTFTEKQVKIMIWSVLVAATATAALQFFIYFNPMMAPMFDKFTTTNADYFLIDQSQGEEATRWSQLSGLSFALVTFAYVLCESGRVRMALLAFSFFMMGLTGFRSRMFRLAVLVFISSICYSRQRVRVLMIWLFIGLAGWGVFALTAIKMPLSIQRVVSVVPGIKVDASISKTAKSSSDWRFDMWKDYCIPNVSKHLLIGRGLVSDVMGFAWVQAEWYGTAEFAYHMHAYHSGPFSLLLDFGLFGTVSFTLFFLLVIKDGWRTARLYASHRNDIISKYYVFLVILMSYELFGYFFIFGSVPTALPRMLAEAAMLRILKKHFLMENLPVADVNPVQSSNGLPPSLKPVNRWAKVTAEVRSQRSGGRRQKAAVGDQPTMSAVELRFAGRRQWAGVGHQVSGDSSATQQLTTNNRASVNRWARSLQRSGV